MNNNQAGELRGGATPSLSSEQFLLDRQVLSDFIEDQNVEIVYGYYGGEGRGGATPSLGWLMVVQDYPSFSVLYMGSTFEEALRFVKWLDVQEQEKDPGYAWEVDAER